MDDRELLHAYIDVQSDEAFAELVRRHVNLVHVTALRLVGDSHTAQDVTQMVFVQLAHRARLIREGNALAGWLYRVACGVAKDTLRRERRRRDRESEAVNRAALDKDSQSAWDAIAPFFDDAMRHLNSKEQNALVLRYLEGKSLRETGHALAMTEDAAQKRVARALEKLRLHFGRRRITISSAVIGTAMAVPAAQAAPAALSASLAATVLAAAVVGAPVGLAVFWQALVATKAKIAVTIIAAIAAGAAALFFLADRNAAASRRATATFRGLGDLKGGDFFSYASGVSADGKVVVGGSMSTNGEEAFRWTARGGIIGLGGLPGGSFSSRAAGISADGTVVVGTSSSAQGGEAFRWTQTTGMIGLGDLPGGRFQSIAYAVSGDGTVVVGESTSARGEREAFRWTRFGGMLGLDDLPGGNFLSYATATSADGLVIVGIGATSPAFEAFRWTKATGMVGLGDFPGGFTNSNAYGVSPDGSIVVGYAMSGAFDDGTHEAFRWTAKSGLVRLGFAPGTHNSAAYAVSADGAVIVGDNKSELPAFALIWDSLHGMRILQQVLTNDYGLDLSGWKLTSARAVSHDGKTIVGSGVNPDGKNEGWIAGLKELPGKKRDPSPNLAQIRQLVTQNEERTGRLKLEYTVKLLGRPTNGVVGDGYRVGGPPYSHYRATWAQDLRKGRFFARQDNFYAPDKLAGSSLAVTDGETTRRGERRADKEWQFYSPPRFEWPIVSTLNEWVHLGPRPFEGHNPLSELLVPEYASIRKYDEQIDGHDTFVVDLRRPLEPVYYARIWIDRTRGVPLRLEYYHEPPGANSTKSASVDSIKLFRLPNNGWIPIAGRRTVFFPQRAQTDEIEVNTNTITTRAQDIPESLFKDVPW